MSLLINNEKLIEFCANALSREGMTPDNSITMSKVLVTTDMWGVYTHGVKNLYGYIIKAEAGGVSFLNQPYVERDDESITVLNGNNTMGYISSVLAMQLACKKAQKTGISASFVKNSCHFGATGYYSNIAASQGLVGFASSNVDKKMSIPGGKGMVMGHNPFSLAAPAKSFPSVILDASSSNVASLRVLKAKELKERIPDSWITDKDGCPTSDPSKYPEEGALQPLGNYKGFGIAMFIEILTSIVLGCSNSTNSDVCSWCFDLEKPNNVCHSFIAINPKIINPNIDLASNVESFINDLHNAPKAKNTNRITVPGEIQWENYNKSLLEGVFLPDDVVGELHKIEKRQGVSIGC